MKDYPKIYFYLRNLPHFDFDYVVTLRRPTTPNQSCPLLNTIIVREEDADYFIHLLNSTSMAGKFTLGNHPGFVSDDIFGETPIVCGYDHNYAFRTLINTLKTSTLKGFDDAIA